jgi:hypothetical protein
MPVSIDDNSGGGKLFANNVGILHVEIDQIANLGLSGVAVYGFGSTLS